MPKANYQIINELREQKSQLINALQSLLDMSSACVKDDEVIENNKRRAYAKSILKTCERSE